MCFHIILFNYNFCMAKNHVVYHHMYLFCKKLLFLFPIAPPGSIDVFTQSIKSHQHNNNQLCSQREIGEIDYFNLKLKYFAEEFLYYILKIQIL